MNLIEELKTVSFEDEYYIEYLKNSDVPLVLYGAGEFAYAVKHILNDNNINIDFVAVDKEYWQPNTKFYSFEIQPLEDILAKNSNVNILFAFIGENDNEKIENLNKMPNVQKCILISTVPIRMGPFITRRYDSDFLCQNSSILTNLYNNLADDLSRQIIFEYMKALRSGNFRELLKLRLGYLFDERDKYFPKFLPISDNETFVDCGAYDGDTIEDFLLKTDGKFNKIFAFETDSNNAKKVREKIAVYNSFARGLRGGGVPVYLIEKGVWEEKKLLCFGKTGTHSNILCEDGNIYIEVDTIDNFCRNEKVTFIKMDIEGSELEALKGAEKQIRENKPKLAICVYHKEEDLITIPQYILSLNPEYKLYLRYFGSSDFNSLWTELVLYAV